MNKIIEVAKIFAMWLNMSNNDIYERRTNQWRLK